MPEHCDGFDFNRCAGEPWHECCSPCPPPGGLLEVHDSKPRLGSPATFYGWENGKNYSARIDELSDNGLWAGAMIFLPQGLGQYWEPNMPIADHQHTDRKLRSVRAYTHEREEFLEVMQRYLNEFGQAWLASGNLLPTPAFSRIGNRMGEFFPPFKEGLDCTAVVIKETAPAVVDISLFYSTGRGWSIQRGVDVLNHEQIKAMKLRRHTYCSMRQPYIDAALAEWNQQYPSS